MPLHTHRLKAFALLISITHRRRRIRKVIHLDTDTRAIAGTLTGTVTHANGVVEILGLAGLILGTDGIISDLALLVAADAVVLQTLVLNDSLWRVAPNVELGIEGVV